MCNNKLLATLAVLAAMTSGAACTTNVQKSVSNAGGMISVTGFSGPEAVRYDPALDVFYVSNFNGEASGDANGFVSLVEADGTIRDLKFMTGSDRWPLHGPRGMYIAGRNLWVVDAEGVHRFDRRTGKQLGFINLTMFEPGFPNDIVRAADGALYVTDTGRSRIYSIADGAASIAANTSMKPNGIAINPETGGLLLAPWEDGQEVVEWDASSGAFSSVATLNGGGNFDGLEVYGEKILVSSQQDTSLHVIVTGVDVRQVSVAGRPADLGIDTKRGRVAVPYVALNRVDIFPIP